VEQGEQGEQGELGTPLLDLVYRIRGLDTVAAHRHVLILRVAAVALASALVLYPILLNHVPDVLELLQRENEAVQHHAHFVFGWHPRRNWWRALLFSRRSHVRLGKL
jgi:hypothetical protein